VQGFPAHKLREASSRDAPSKPGRPPLPWPIQRQKILEAERDMTCLGALLQAGTARCMELGQQNRGWSAGLIDPAPSPVAEVM